MVKNLLSALKTTLLLLFFISSCATKKQPVNSGSPLASPAVSISPLESGFKTPPDSVRLGTWWHWLNDNASSEGIKKDLEAMSKVGIGRAYIYHVAQPTDFSPYGDIKMKIPIGTNKLFSDEWWQRMEDAMKYGEQYGVEIGLMPCPGWGAGGPWIKNDKAARYLASYETAVKGPMKFSKRLSVPGEFQPVSVIAFPLSSSEGNTIATYKPRIKSNPELKEIQNLFDGNLKTVQQLENIQTLTIDFELVKKFTARSIQLYSASKPVSGNCKFQVLEGQEYKTTKEFYFGRTNFDLAVGFLPNGPVTIALPEISGKKFRLIFELYQKGPLAEIVISETSKLENYVEKELGKMFQSPLPLWKDYQWSDVAEPQDKSSIIATSKVLDITKNMDADGTLNWNIPAGKWMIVQYGMLPTGVKNSPAPEGGSGYEVDKLSAKNLKAQFDGYTGEILKRIPAEKRKALKWIDMDSFEAGAQNWTDEFSNRFKAQYGYDPLPWLPVLTGRIVESANLSDRFLWDLRRLVADGITEEFAKGLLNLSHENNLKLYLQNYGHWGFSGEFLSYGKYCDEISGEFWSEGELGSIEARAAASSAHIYGKNKVTAESFTAGGLFYQRYPGYLKKRGDWSFTEGINSTIWHLYVHQPYEDKKPGMATPWGLEFNRHNTWFEQSKAYADYTRRCNFILQQGRQVNDIAYFIGEGTPAMTGPLDPAVPKGYSYDHINADVIINRLTVKDGNLVLPNGMSYKILVLPKLETMRPEVLRKITDMVLEGATVIGPKPLRSPSLQNYPNSDEEVKMLAEELWGHVDGKNIKSRIYGKGRIISGMDIQPVLNSLNASPDFKVNADSVLYVHRTFSEGEIYFVTNQSNKTIDISPEFRVSNKQPEFWDAVTGTFRNLPVYTQHENTTTVPLTLEASQSGFVIFRKEVLANTQKSGASNFPKPKFISEIISPWEVTFDAAMRGPEKPVIFDKLVDWTNRPEESIKFYSGTAVYRNILKIEKIEPGQRLFLNLNPVKVMARVKVNGIEQGIVWTAPWRLEVTKALKVGENKLEIEVVNNWANRIIGDSKDPYEERKSYTNFVNAFNPQSPLDPSGMKGPVVLEEIKY